MFTRFAHILAGFTLGFRHRSELSRLLMETSLEASIFSMDPENLKAQGIAALALDFDGVLAGHGFPYPIPEAVDWIKSCEVVFGGENIFILSNKPTDERREWFEINFPSIRLISGVRKKPFPDGLNKTGALSGVPLSSIMMVDDRLLTGCLAAILAGARPCYIRRPFVSFRHRTLDELFFWFLRTGERLFVRIISPF